MGLLLNNLSNGQLSKPFRTDARLMLKPQYLGRWNTTREPLQTTELPTKARRALPSGHRPYLESVMKTKSGSRRLAHRSETACSREIKGAQLVVTMITTTFDSDLSTTQT
ncbi:hypothetical protein KCU87_g486, partial [Aureobasidium melanogenum]